MRVALLLAMVALVAACGQSATSENGRCAVLENRRFVSVDLQSDCGPAPQGGGDCHWTVHFSAVDEDTTEFQYHYSDVIESGTARCTILQQPDISIGSDTEFTGSYNTTTGNLTWDGIVFAPAAQ